MAAGQLTPTKFGFQGIIPIIMEVTRGGSASDWVFTYDPNAGTGVAGNVPGAVHGTVLTMLYTGAVDTVLFGTATIAANSSTGTAANSATGTLLNVTSAPTDRTNAGTPFAIMTTAGEFMLVTSDSAPTSGTTTLTVVRGAYGSTAAVLPIGATVYFLNVLYLATAVTASSVEFIVFTPLPADPNAKLFGSPY